MARIIRYPHSPMNIIPEASAIPVLISGEQHQGEGDFMTFKHGLHQAGSNDVDHLDVGRREFLRNGGAAGLVGAEIGAGMIVPMGSALAQTGLDFSSEEHTSELKSLMRHSYDVICLYKKTKAQRKAT